MTSPRVAGALRPPEPPPEASQPGAIVWLRKNLFFSVGSTVLTLVLGAVILVGLRTVLGFLFAENRMWEVIPRNATNYAVGTYPRSELERIWLSLHIVFFLAGVSTAVWRPTGMTSVAKVSAGFRALGITLLLVGILAPASFGWHLATLVIGAVLVFATVVVNRTLSADAVVDRIPIQAVLAGTVVAFLALVWLLPVDASTKVPLTVGVGVGVVGHLLGRILAARLPSGALRAALVGTWLVSLPVIYLHVQRRPQVDWDTVTGQWLPWILGATLGGAAVIWVVSRSDRERAGVVNALLVIAAAGVWAIDAPMLGRALVFLLAVISLATPTFGSSEASRPKILGVWFGLALFATYLFAIGDARAGLDTRNEYFGGMNLTLMLAVGSLLLSFPMGVTLALGRTSTMPIFRLLSTGYIELVRGVPLITLLFIARFGIFNFLPPAFDPDPNVLVLGGFTLFSAAYLAENVRGGLQSVPRGQYEAAKALGMTTAQMTMLITLPQALRAVIPAIVGQVIALFKDTSLVAIVGLAEFFRVARDVVPNQPTSLGSILENLIFAAAVYWVFTYNFSRASQRLERKLGVGTR
jgi:general L-amino acid transport system permease protein